MQVRLVNNKRMPPYAACKEMEVGKVYTVSKQKINDYNQRVYMFDGIYGWKLAARFVEIKN